MPNRANPNTINVLMVDDDEKDFAFVDKLFRLQTSLEADKRLTDDHEFHISHALTLADALIKLKAQDFDVIILDYNLPEVEGLEALRLITAAHPLVPVVMLTGMDSEKLGVDTIMEGAQDYLVKSSISRQTLLKTVRYAIARFEALQKGLTPSEWESKFHSQVETLRSLRSAIESLDQTVKDSIGDTTPNQIEAQARLQARSDAQAETIEEIKTLHPGLPASPASPTAPTKEEK